MPLKSGSQALPFDPLRVGERFLTEREKLGLSRADLADKCGYGAEQVRRVELGMQAPGARLLAALAEAGGDVRGLLLGAGFEEEIEEIDAIYAAELRDRWRREARMWRQAKADRRKRLVSDDEADLLDAYRELDHNQRVRAIELVSAIKFGADGASGVRHQGVTATHGGIAAGRDVLHGVVHEAKPPRYKTRKPKR